MTAENEERLDDAAGNLMDEDDLEAQMAAAMAAEGLGDGMSKGSDEDDLEAQMAAAMAANDHPAADDNDLLDDSLAGAFDEDNGREPVPVKQLQFAQLRPSDEMNGRENIERLLDVSLNLSVELGRKNMQIKEILDLGPGKIIELDKLAGEPVDLLVNGRLLAKGEVVVVDENFGVRITDLVDPRDRIRSL